MQTLEKLRHAIHGELVYWKAFHACTFEKAFEYLRESIGQTSFLISPRYGQNHHLVTIVGGGYDWFFDFIALVVEGFLDGATWLFQAPPALLMVALFAALAWNVFLTPLQAFMRDYSPMTWFWIIYVGVMGTVVPFGFYNEGINLIRSTRASITGMLEPITAGVLSYFFLGEVFESWQLLGAVLVIVAIVLLQLKQETDRKAPEMIRSETGRGE